MFHGHKYFFLHFRHPSLSLFPLSLLSPPSSFTLSLNLQKHPSGCSTRRMQLLGTKTNTQCVHAGTDVSRQDGNRGNREHTGGRRLRCAPAQIFTSLGVCGFYYHLGANIQPGVLGKGRESGDDRNEKETWTWQPTGAQGT